MGVTVPTAVAQSVGGQKESKALVDTQYIYNTPASYAAAPSCRVANAGEKRTAPAFMKKSLIATQMWRR